MQSTINYIIIYIYTYNIYRERESAKDQIVESRHPGHDVVHCPCASTVFGTLRLRDTGEFFESDSPAKHGSSKTMPCATKAGAARTRVDMS